MKNSRVLLRSLFSAAVAAADAKQAIRDNLPTRPPGKTVVVGAGKAAAAMAAAVESTWQAPVTGVVVTRYGHACACQAINVVEAGHPVPDIQGQNAARHMLELATTLTPQDLLLCLWSGGGSALLTLPYAGVSLEDKQSINRQLLNSGAVISEINCVRKHLSAIKGGRLAKATQGATVESLIISDVAGDDLAVIASGPTTGDPTSCLDALQIIARYDIQLPDKIRQMLERGTSETPFPGDPIFSNTHHRVIASGERSLNAAITIAESRGFATINLGDRVEGDAQEVARQQAALLRQHINSQPQSPLALFSGGETTVTVQGNGRGGPNREFLLALALELDGQPQVSALAADTDGIDGSDDDAGAIITPDTLQRANNIGLDASMSLRTNDAGTFFDAIGDNVHTGPTLTNVNDFRVLMYQPES